MSRPAEDELELEENEEELMTILPLIFEGEWQNSLPAGFNTVFISLDGRAQSDLNWKKAEEQAIKASDLGYAIMWEIGLGLFDDLPQSLAHQTQFLTLTLSLEHFRDTLWKKFKAQTVGISIFRGSADFSEHFKWDDHQRENLKIWLQDIKAANYSHLTIDQLQNDVKGQQLIRLFCRDVAVEYLSLLATRLPDSLPCYLYLKADSLKSALGSELQLLNPERYDRLNLALQGAKFPFEAIGWNHPTSLGYSGIEKVSLPTSAQVFIGICIPSLNCLDFSVYCELEQHLLQLKDKHLPFKLIAENHLTSQWDGLDYLIYHPRGLSVQGKRKLQGFCAAGGTSVSIENLIGLSIEMEFKDWLEKI